ncbi:SufS family cysteine desulfurase [Planctomicrobium sp. SH661]|uniref:SufS family cysteine desulfurase n=1 Tax=Planctomicrobium sp. SH661 TaxID=3448124 RepID=UPI003F5C64E3
MHELTPEKLTEITSRLYNMLPGTASPQIPSTSASHYPPISPGTPLPKMESENIGFGVQSDPVPHVSESLTTAAKKISARNAAENRLHAESQSAINPRPSADSGRTEGLRNFVRGLQTSHVASQSGLGNTASQYVSPPVGNIYQPTAPFSHSNTSLFSGRNPIRESGRPFDVASIRRDFPILNQRIHGHPLVWMDNAATTQKPQCVIDELARFYANDNSNIHRGAHSLAARATDAYEDARKKVQRFLGASSVEEIVFVRGTTEGINLVAQTCGRKFLQRGDEIILTTLEHHANIVPWQMVAQETGAVIRVVPVNDSGEIILEDYQRLLGPRTRLVAFTHANNSLGTLLPVAEMTQMAKRYGARVLIDGAQSVAHIPVNVQELGCDFYVFSGHKIFGPTGIGAVYVKSELLELMPPWQGGGSMIKDVTFEQTTYSDPPAKFEAGTPNIADAVGLGAALDYVTQLGLPQIAHHEHQLLEYATEQLSRIDGVRLVGTAREKVSVVSFVMQNRPTEEVGRLLDREGIAVRSGHHCAQPSLRRFGLESTVRPSFSIYNTYDEIDHLVNSVKRIRHSSPNVSRIF